MIMAQLKFKGNIINVPESDVDWFVKNKGAERVGAKKSNDGGNNDGGGNDTELIAGKTKSEWSKTKVGDIDAAIAEINDVETLKAVLACVDTVGGQNKINAKIESLNN